MQFNSKDFTNFRNDVNEALEEIANKYGVNITTGKIKYSEFDFTMELKAIKQEEGLDGNQKEFEKVCFLFGFKPEHYKARFSLQGREFELVGFNPRSPKNCCSIKSVTDGKGYKCGDEAVKRALKLTETHTTANTHKCKYCGNIVKGTYTDLLCDDCKMTFGHSLYSEL